MGWKKWAGSWKKVKYCCPFPVLPSCQNGCLLESTSRTQNIYLLFSLQLFTSPISNPSTFQFLKCRLVYLFILTNSDRVVWHVDSLVCALSKDLKEVFSLSWQPIMPPHIERWDRSSNFLLILVSGSVHRGMSPRPLRYKCRETSGSEFDQIGRSWFSSGQDLQLR